jgi:hypothetical protein
MPFCSASASCSFWSSAASASASTSAAAMSFCWVAPPDLLAGTAAASDGEPAVEGVPEAGLTDLLPPALAPGAGEAGSLLRAWSASIGSLHKWGATAGFAPGTHAGSQHVHHPARLVHLPSRLMSIVPCTFERAWLPRLTGLVGSYCSLEEEGTDRIRNSSCHRYGPKDGMAKAPPMLQITILIQILVWAFVHSERR